VLESLDNTSVPSVVKTASPDGIYILLPVKLRGQGGMALCPNFSMSWRLAVRNMSNQTRFTYVHPDEAGGDSFP
jgi:hypothetical protein